MSKSIPEDASETKAGKENELEMNLQDIVVDEELSAYIYNQAYFDRI